MSSTPSIKASHGKLMSQSSINPFSRNWPIFLIVISAITAFIGTYGLISAHSSNYWPQADAKVISSSVKKSSRTRSGHKNKRRSNKKSYSYRADVLYEYSVDKYTYHGKRIAFGDFGSGSRGHATRIAGRYQEGRNVKVSYNRDNPLESVLEPGIKGQALIQAVICFTIGFSSLLAAIYLSKKHKI